MTTYPYGGEAARTLTGNNEAEFYSDSSVGENPFSLNNGVLTIAATPAAAGSNPYGLPYDSGVITTNGSFSQTYGYFEVNAKLPDEQGLWPAFWMLPSSNVYTSELDVFEQVDNNPTTLVVTTHGSTNGSWGADSQAVTVPNTGTGFNTYGVDWEPTTTTFYVDGVEVATAPTPASMNNPMYMILNLAVGGQGSWPGSPDSSTSFPADMQINWVHAYATANTNYVGGSASIPASGSAAAEAAAAAAEGGTTTATAATTTTTASSTATSSSSNNATTTPATVTIGSGSDTLALQIAEDAYQGNAQFTVSVDGVQIGGTQTATALQSSGATQTFNVQGNFGAGSHSVSVNFLNDAYGGSSATDRNLYVDSATIDGAGVSGAALSLFNTGAKSFNFTGAASTAAPTTAATTTAATSTAPVTIGSGADTLALHVAEDAWQGNAQFTVSVDGVQIGGTQTATALQSSGASQTFNVLGSFAPGSHTVAVDFLNDAYGGSSSTDRNLYVNGATIDGTAISGSNLTLDWTGSQSFNFSEAGAAAASTATSTASTTSSTAPVTIGSGSDAFSLGISEDAWQGNAQYTVSVDGVQVGGTQTATALHGARCDPGSYRERQLGDWHPHGRGQLHQRCLWRLGDNRSQSLCQQRGL